MNKQNKLPRNKKAVGRAAYAAAFLALLVAALVAVNIIVSALAGSYPLSVDMTKSGRYTLSDENADFLRGVTDKTEIIVLASESDYVGEYYNYYVQNTYSISGAANDYFEQTANILNQYHKYNKNINVTFTDPYDPSFADVASRFSDVSYYYGDILIAVTDENGNETHAALGFQDIYELTSNYYYNSVAGNNIETAVATKLNAVSGGIGINIAVMADFSEASVVSSIQSILEANNCEFSEISGLQISAISSDYDAVLIAAPPKDLGESEVSAINTFLENGGKGGKTVLYFASAYSPETPNLEQLLNEWGVSTEDGVLYETNSNNHLQGEPTTIGVINNDTNYAKNQSNTIYISGNNVPLTQVFESHENRATELVFSSSSTTVVKSSNAGDDFASTIDSSSAQSYPVVVACTDTSGDETSTLVVFASDDFANSQWLTASSVGNADSILSVVAVASGSEGSINFVTKTVDSNYFTDLNSRGVLFFKLLFTVIVPVGIVIIGIMVIYKRRHCQ